VFQKKRKKFQILFRMFIWYLRVSFWILIGFHLQILKAQDTSGQTTNQTTKAQCPSETVCTCDFSKKLYSLICTNFTSFSQLDFRNNTIAFNSVVIRPLASLDLDYTFNLTGLKLMRSTIVQLENIKSFPYAPSPFRNVQVTDGGGSKFSSLIIKDSVVSFKTENNQNVSDVCDLKKFEPVRHSFFAFSYNLELNRVRIPAPLCPLLFMYTTFFNVRIVSSVSYPDTNSKFKFTSILNKPANFSLNNRIDYFRIKRSDLANLNSDDHLPVDMLSKTKSIVFDETNISLIRPNAFANLTSLIMLEFASNPNLDGIFSNDTRWLSTLNSNGRKGKKPKFKLVLNKFNYSFTDKDLCKFRYFPHDNCVYPLLMPNAKLECSCTLFWITKNISDFRNDREMSHTMNNYNCYADNSTAFAKFYNSCEFETNFASCIDYYDEAAFLIANQDNQARFRIYVIVGVFIGALVLIVGVSLFVYIRRFKFSRIGSHRFDTRHETIELEPIRL
jgi:hypothetical protein